MRRCLSITALASLVSLVPLTVSQAKSPAKAAKPIPEYAPVQAVLLSEDLFNFGYHAQELVDAIISADADVWIATAEPRAADTLKATLRAAGVSELALKRMAFAELAHGNVWLRDYGPMPISDAAGHLAFFNFRYDDSTKVNDAFPAAVGKALGVPVIQDDLLLDGGNFLTNGAVCLTSQPDVAISKEIHPERHLERLGCRETIVIKDPPHAHLDMWVKIANDRTLLVNELTDRSLAVAERIYGHVPPELKELRDSLNRNAAELSRVFTVKRLPMPLPYRNVFRTYANAALVNGHAIVPSFDRFGWGYDDYPDAELKSYYEDEAAKVYRALGFQVRFINADGLIFNGGAFHCVTAQIPAGSLPPLHLGKGH